MQVIFASCMRWICLEPRGGCHQNLGDLAAFFRRSDVAGNRVTISVPSGKQPHNYGKSPFIVDFPIENGDFP